MTHRALRWLPAVIAPVVVAGAVALPLAATASTDLPARSAAQVLALVAHARSLPGYTGEISQTSDLGLPQLPSTGAGSDSQTASTLNLLTGSHRASIAVDGTSRSRIAVQDSMGERDVVRNGGTVWFWDSAKSSAEQVTASGARTAPDDGTTMTPQSAAEEAIARITPSTDVTVDTTTSVAGHDAYTLVLTPKASDTTVGSVRIAVDGTTGLPLRVQLFAQGAASPAFEVAFSQLDYSVPAASRFDFTAPSGAKVEQHTVTPGAQRPSTGAAARGEADGDRLRLGRGRHGARGGRPGLARLERDLHAPHHGRRRRCPCALDLARERAASRPTDGCWPVRCRSAACRRSPPRAEPRVGEAAHAVLTHGLTKRFGSRNAVDGIDLAVPTGSVFGFLGPNGSGKTTTIRMLLGLIGATSGSVEVLGEPMPDRWASVLPRVGALVEGPGFAPVPLGRREPPPPRLRGSARRRPHPLAAGSRMRSTASA